MTPAPDDRAPRRSEHRLVVLRRDGGGELAIHLLKAGNAWTLPRVELPEHRSADVADVNRAVRTSLGLETSVLRCLADEPGTCRQPRRHLHPLEAHGVDQAARCGQWATWDAALAESFLPDAAHDWTRLGWRDGARVGRRTARSRRLATGLGRDTGSRLGIFPGACPPHRRRPALLQGQTGVWGS